MYKVEKKFTFPMGHRLSKHSGACANIHGHNFNVMVGVKSHILNENDMVIDFSDLKDIVNEIIRPLDHCTLLNKDDEDFIAFCTKMGSKIMKVPSDPTAEALAKALYDNIKLKLPENVEVDYITVYENENSKATYTED
jgi:6-pyruvoyltetrahydropterin/6-carboxytetrahydropterin synthase